jgi:hypothetical protein
MITYEGLNAGRDVLCGNAVSGDFFDFAVELVLPD